MYIQPSSNIRLLKGVPLDNTYEHTIYFNDEITQRNYFLGKTKHNLTNQTFQRTGRGIARLQLNIGACYDCSYMMFQNTSFSNKWFYAFITSIEYVNNEVTEISFEIDVMQTWLFDYTLGECYIERQHTTTDVIGGNIVPEPVALGEYVFNDYAELNYRWIATGNIPVNGEYLHELCVIIAIVDVQASASDGNLYDNIYGAAKLFAYDREDVTSINAKVTEYVQKPDSIIAMYMAPKIAIATEITTGGIEVPRGTSGAALRHTATMLTSNVALDGYAPVRNRKLYTYPYNFYHVDNANGNGLELRYEFFDNLQPKMVLLTTITQPIDIALRPQSYKNVNALNNNESLALSGYPMCSWNVDAYKAWVAQNSVPLAINTANSLLQTGISAGGVRNKEFVGSVLDNVTNVATQMYTASIQADMSKGSFNNGGVNCSKLQQAFFGGRMSITSDMAKRIDDFFDYFGYQINALGVPNRNARRYWTYIKTATCVFTGDVPNDDMKQIANIYNTGITFWNDGDNVGNYSLDNTV